VKLHDREKLQLNEQLQNTLDEMAEFKEMVEHLNFEN